MVFRRRARDATIFARNVSLSDANRGRSDERDEGRDSQYSTKPTTDRGSEKDHHDGAGAGRQPGGKRAAREEYRDFFGRDRPARRALLRCGAAPGKEDVPGAGRAP